MQLQNKKFKNLIPDRKIPIIITVAFFLITLYVAAFHHNYWVIDHDGQIYLHAGEQILAGNGSNVKLHNAPVGGPVIYAFLNQFFDNGFGVMKSISVLSASGAVFFSYFILNNIFNRRVALVGQLFFAFNPWLGFFAIQAENELLPIFLISVSLYFITKKELKLQDIVIVGILLGVAATIRFQAIIALMSFIIFLFLQGKKIRQPSFFSMIILFAFLITLSPMIFYNYTTHESIFDTNAAFFIQMENKYHYPEWQEALKQINFSNGSTIDAVFVDFDLFLQNYFHNLFYNLPNRLFNFNYDNLNVSLINSVPFIGLIPIIGGLVYLFKIKINKNNLIIIASSAITSAILIFLIGEIKIHFFAIIGVPLFFLCLFNARKVQKNALPLLIIPALFALMLSVALLRVGEHYFLAWFSLAMLGGVFFAEVLPKIFRKIQSVDPELNLPRKTWFLIIVIIALILLSNLGYGYVAYSATHSNESFVSVEDEFTKLFQNKSLEQPGMEIKKIGDILSKQHDIENSYVMVPHHHYAYYINGKTVLAQFGEGIPDDTFENYVTRKNWTDTEIFNSNLFSQPMDRQDLNKPKPDYLIYAVVHNDNSSHHEYLKILGEPDNPMVPSNFEVLYSSDKSNALHVIYKINYENDN